MKQELPTPSTVQGTGALIAHWQGQHTRLGIRGILMSLVQCSFSQIRFHTLTDDADWVCGCLEASDTSTDTEHT